MNDTTFEIPPRNTRAFAEYKAGVEWEFQQGTPLEYRILRTSSDDWRDREDPKAELCWDGCDYRVAEPEELHPIDQWRAMSPEEREGKVLEFSDEPAAAWVASDYMDERIGSITRCARNNPQLYRIRELTLAERNAAIRAKWEAMEETEDKAFRTKDGKRYRVEFLNRSPEGIGWLDNDDALRIPHPQSPSAWYDGSPLHTHVEYRLVPAPEPPQPRYVPWTIDSCPVGAVIRAKNTARVRVMIIGAAAQSAAVSQAGSYTYEQLLEEWTMDDGTPAGTLEQPQP